MRKPVSVRLGLSARVAVGLLSAGIAGASLAAAPTPVGNGVVVSPDGYILTLAHLVQERTNLAVSVRGKAARAAVVAVDKTLDIALLKIPAQGAVRAVLAPAAGGTGKADLYAIGGGLGLSDDKALRQSEVDLFGNFGPARADERPGVLVLNGPADPGLDGSPVFDRHGDVVGLLNARWSGSPPAPACALDIRAACDFLQKHHVGFSTGGAPIEHSLENLFGMTCGAVVTLTGPGVNLPPDYAPLAAATPVVRLRKPVSFMGLAGAFSPDGSRIAVVRHLGSGPSSCSEIVLFDRKTGAEKMTLTGQASWADSLLFSPDSRFLLSIVPQLGFGLQHPAFLWNLENGAVWYHLPPAHDGAFSPDGSRIVLRVGDKGKSWRLLPRLSTNVEARVHRSDTGAPVASIVPGNYQLCGELYQCLFLPRSGRLLTVGFWYNFKTKGFESLHEWDPETGALVRRLEPQPALVYPEYGYVNGLAAISPDERTLVLEGYTAGALAVVYDYPSLQARYTIPEGPNDERHAPGAQFSPDGRFFLLQGRRHITSFVRMHDTASGSAVWRFDGERHAAFSPDGGQLLQIFRNGVTLWDLPKGDR